MKHGGNRADRNRYRRKWCEREGQNSDGLEDAANIKKYVRPWAAAEGMVGATNDMCIMISYFIICFRCEASTQLQLLHDVHVLSC